MTLENARAGIDRIDPKLRSLLMERMDCSVQVVRAKQEAGSTTIYRADREQQILDRLGQGVPADRLAPYLSVVRKVMEASRMYQYGMLYAHDPQLFCLVSGHELCNQPCSRVTVELARPNKPGSLALVLGMIGDHGFDVVELQQLAARQAGVAGEGDADATAKSDAGVPEAACESAAPEAAFRLTIAADASQDAARKLLFQLSKECSSFRVVDCA